MNKLFEEIVFRSKIGHHCYESAFLVVDKYLTLALKTAFI